jgi:MFS family permease
MLGRLGGLFDRVKSIEYKWIALSNTTLGTLMAFLNASILLISLPDIFRGIGINPLAPEETTFLLWTLMGYMVVTAVVLVTFGRISDIYGRVRLYNLGFAIFTLGSILLYFVQGTGDSAAVQIIIFRVVQGIGGAFLMSNSAAILTDAFKKNERGFALGINQVAGLSGSFLGLLIGGLLSPISWRAVFLVSVPFGVIGTVWAYLMLKETSTQKKKQKIDYAGNILFAGGLILILVAITYSLLPYGDSPMGWSSPYVLGGFALGISLLAAFVWYEPKVKDPLFDFKLFRIRHFAMGNLAGFLSSIARGGLQFLVVIWLQGIWLPLHGYAFEETPFWAAVYMLPLTIAIFIFGPVSGYASDKIGSRHLATLGMMLTVFAFLGLSLLPANFSYIIFAGLLFLMGVGMGLFASPNTAQIMNSVPETQRGIASGMRATFLNVGATLSIGLIFTMVTIGISAGLPQQLYTGLTQAGIPQETATKVSQLPPTGALFASFLGYNPLQTLIPQEVLTTLPKETVNHVLSEEFFPQLLSNPFTDGARIAFILSLALSLLGAIASWLSGE